MSTNVLPVNWEDDNYGWGICGALTRSVPHSTERGICGNTVKFTGPKESSCCPACGTWWTPETREKCD